MTEAFGSAQPTLSKAREQAIKNGFPYFILISSTPNGTVGTGEFFYELNKYAVDSETLFDDKDHLINDAPLLINNPERNGYALVRYHWKEDPTKNDKWYTQQCRDLNFNERMINQELDLLFVGSSNCIFTDKFLGELSYVKPFDTIKLPHQTELKIFTDTFDADDFLIIGADTAKSLVGDFNAIEIFSYHSFIQIGEYFGKLGSLTKYSQVLMAIIDYFSKIYGDRLLLAIENNNMGAAIIEDLENADNDYDQYIYSPEPIKYIGINTNVKTKPTMISYFYDFVIDNPWCIKSRDLINQLNIIERFHNGSIRAQTGKHDDLFMAGSLCAYVKRLSALDYDPLINIGKIEQKVKIDQTYNKVFFDEKTISDIAVTYNKEERGYEYHNLSEEDSIIIF